MVGHLFPVYTCGWAGLGKKDTKEGIKMLQHLISSNLFKNKYLE